MNNSNRRLIICVWVVLGVSAAVSIFLFFVKSTMTTVMDVKRVKQLQLIGVALLHYSRDHGTYPPAYTVDKNGRRMHSWRVLLLPYLGQASLYAEIRLDEPWNSPHNAAYANRMPSDYQSPERENNSSETNYLAVLHAQGPWRGADSVRADAINEGSIVHLIESVNSKICWMEPTDATPEEALEVLWPIGAAGATGDRRPRYYYYQTADLISHVTYESPNRDSLRDTLRGVTRQK